MYRLENWWPKLNRTKCKGTGFSRQYSPVPKIPWGLQLADHCLESRSRSSYLQAYFWYTQSSRCDSSAKNLSCSPRNTMRAHSRHSAPCRVPDDLAWLPYPQQSAPSLARWTNFSRLRRYFFKIKKNSVVWVRERTIPTKRPPLVGEVSANYCVYIESRGSFYY
jgi:hypothetical protein